MPGNPTVTERAYLDFLAQLKSRIARARLNAVRAVNRELVELYWDMGLAIKEKQAVHGWGDAVVKNIALDLVAAFPGNSGFSASNLWRMATELGVASEPVRLHLERLEAEAKTAVVLSTDKVALAVLAVADTVRESSREAVAALKRLGVEPVMLTGDNSRTAAAVAAQVGISDARGDLLPQDKLEAIEKFAANGPVGMVGDGVNDAPALAKSNIGFAMGAAGTDTAIETADVALMQDDLRKLPEFIALSRRVGGVLKANIAFAITTKAIFMVLAFTGHASLWLAILADMGASLIVVFNGLRLLRRPTSGDRRHAD